MTNKKRDPSYITTTFGAPRELFLIFKSYCARHELQMSEELARMVKAEMNRKGLLEGEKHDG